MLRVRDVPASLAYYEERLGCRTVWSHPEEAPIIAQVEREDLALILDSESGVPKPASTSVVTVTLRDEQQLGALHRELAEAGALVRAAPFPVSWSPGVYQLDVADPDGNWLVFWGAAP